MKKEKYLDRKTCPVCRHPAGQPLSEALFAEGRKLKKENEELKRQVTHLGKIVNDAYNALAGIVSLPASK